MFENEYLTEDMSRALEYAFDNAATDFSGYKWAHMYKLESQDTYPFNMVFEEEKKTIREQKKLLT